LHQKSQCLQGIGSYKEQRRARVSHSENYIDRGATSSYYQGVEAGKEEERRRIVKLIQDYSPDLDTLRLVALIEGSQTDTFEDVTDRELYEEGVSDAGDIIFAVIDRLRCSVHDWQELTDTDTSKEQRLLQLIVERYEDGMWEKRDSRS
jgi:hypothetical protein